MGSSDEGEAESEVMRANDQEVEDEGIDVMDKEESGSPEPVSKGWPPQEVEVRAQGVWAKWNIYRGMRLGPFLGRWTSEKPADPNNYWEVRVGTNIRRYMDATGDFNWLTRVKSAAEPDAANLRPIWRNQQIYYETVREVAAGQELLLPPREPLQLDYLLSCTTQPDDRSDRESASQHSGTFEEDRDEEVEEEEDSACNICGKICTDNDALDDHLVDSHHLQQNQFRCRQCPRGFCTPAGLTRHGVSHTHKFSCEHCHTVFTDRSNLQRHIRTAHVGARSHACEECGKTFASSSGLKQHSHIHSSVKPFQCDVCLKAYTQFSNLCRHKRMHVSCRLQVKCPRCGQTFSTSNALAKHKRFCDPGNSRFCDKGGRSPPAPMPLIPANNSPNPYLLYHRSPFYPPPPSLLSPYAPHLVPAGHPAGSFLNNSLLNHPQKPFDEKMLFKPSIFNGDMKKYHSSEEHFMSMLKDKADLDIIRRSTTSPLISPCQSYGFNKISPNSSEENTSKPSRQRLSLKTFGSFLTVAKDTSSEPDIDVVGVQPEPQDLSTSTETKRLPGDERNSPDTSASDKCNDEQPLDLRVEGKRAVDDIKKEAVSEPRDKTDENDSPAKRLKTEEFDNDSNDSEQSRSPSPPTLIHSPARKSRSPTSPRNTLMVKPSSELMKSSSPPSLQSPVLKGIPSQEDNKLPSMVYPIPQYPHPTIRFDRMLYPFPPIHNHNSNQNHDRLLQSHLPPFPNQLQQSAFLATMMNGLANGQGIHRPPLENILRSPLDRFPSGNRPYNEVLNQQADSVNGIRTKDKYACSYCGKVFPRSANLTRHLRTHTGEQPYKCKYCERCFSISSNLQRHVRNIHNKEKPFKCPLCDRCFGQQTNLDRHLKKHEGTDGNGHVAVADSPSSSNDNDGEDQCVEIRDFVGRVAYSMESFNNKLNLNLLNQFKMPSSPNGPELMNANQNHAEEEDSEITLESDRDSPIEPYSFGKSGFQDSPLGLVMNKALDYVVTKDISSPDYDLKLKAEDEDSSINNNISETRINRGIEIST